MLFLFTFLACFFNSVPILINTTPEIQSWGNVFSIVSIFGILFWCFRVQLLVTDHFFKKHLLLFDVLLFLDALITIGLRIIFLKDPTIYSLSISWNVNIVSQTMFSITCFTYGLYWAWLFGRVARILRDKALKKKMYILCMNGLLQGTAAIFIFSNDTYQSLFGLSLIFIAALISILLYLTEDEQKHEVLTNKGFSIA